MRWGVRDEATDDHQTANLCSREIDNCQRMSLGPNFVALLGDKYGFRPLCNKIKSVEFRALRRCLIELDINTDFLDTWYKEDLNAVPPEYLLQPISSILKNFTNKNEPDLQAVDQRIWSAIQERLHSLLMIGSQRLVEQGRMSAHDQLIKYSISVTEREVIEGCLDAGEAKNHCLVYIRSIKDLRKHLELCLESLNNFSPTSQRSTTSTDLLASNNYSQSQAQERKDSQARKASLKIGNDSINLTTNTALNSAERRVEKNRKLIGRYIDLVSRDDVWKLDEEAQDALNNLKTNKLGRKFKLNGRNLIEFDISWLEHEGISSKFDQHRIYLNELVEHFLTNIIKMIRKASKNQQELKSGLIGEILQHSHYAKHVSRTFYGRFDELELIKSYIFTKPANDCGKWNQILPMFLYGVGGSGKTSLMAKAATLAKEWYFSENNENDNDIPWNRRPCIIMRFCCTTPNSSTMVGILTSICHQLQYNFYQFGPLNGIHHTSNQLDMSEEANNADGGSGSNENGQLAYEKVPEDFIRLAFTFRQLLDNCGHELHRQRKFLILIDSLERLSSPPGSNVELKYSWLTGIVKLPDNVRLIVSCSSESTNEFWAQDYRYLKRHFLRTYVNKSMTFERDETDLDELEDDLGEKFGDKSRENSDEIKEVNRKYHNLKQILVPAVKFMRILTSKREKSGENSSQHRKLSKSSIKFPPIDIKNTPIEGELSPIHSPNNFTIESNPSTKFDQLDSNAWIDSPKSHRRERQKSKQTNNGIWILHVKPLGVQLALKVAKRWLNDAGRNLTSQQWAIVESSFSQCSRPIFVKLAFGEIINWKSYSMQSNSKGSTFGSSLLLSDSNERFQPLWTGDALVEARFKKLIEHFSGLTTDDGLLENQTLCMEQQWMNYLEFEQRKQQAALNSSENGKDKSSLVIRIGSQTNNANIENATSNQRATSSSSGANFSGSICHLSSTINDAIYQLFARIELQHGYILTKHSLSYITVAKNGICENELEDILSLDDVVLDDVFQYHLPPVRRIPPLLWTRIRNDLPDYLSERDADGIVVNWHHSQFKRVTLDRYLMDEKQLIYIHSVLADYFLGKWAGKAKPFRCTRQQIEMATDQLESAVQQSIRDSQAFASSSVRANQNRVSVSGGRLIGAGNSIGNRMGTSFSVRSRLRSSDQFDQRLQWMQAKADRRVPQQPLFYDMGVDNSSETASSPTAEQKSKSGETFKLPNGNAFGGLEMNSASQMHKRRYNTRKLTELPYHLMRSGRFLDLANHVLFNYNWLFCALSATGLQNLLADFEESVKTLERALENSIERESQFKLDNSNFPAEPEARHRQSIVADQQDGVSLADDLPSQTLRSLIEQITILNNALRLSCSSLNIDTQMLAPQLVGRMLPLTEDFKSKTSASVGGDGGNVGPIDGDTGMGAGQSPGSTQTSAKQGICFKYLRQLLDQCDKDGCSDIALLPIGHCLQSPNGLQLSSLEGHSFAIMDMAMAADQRHLLAISNKFIMWDITTGEISRDIDAKIEGSIMKELKMGLNNEFAIVYTSDNTILLLDILTQQVVKFVGLRNEQILGINLIDKIGATKFLAWSGTKYFSFQVINNEETINLNSNYKTRGNSAERMTIELTESIDLRAKSNTSFGSILNVRMLDNLLFIETSSSDGQFIQLIVIERDLETIEMWPQTICAKSMAFDENNCKQLIYSDFDGRIYLRRRRKNCWSRERLIQLDNSIDVADCQVKLNLLAIELIKGNEFESQIDDEHSTLLVNGISLRNLANFEKQCDSVRADEEIERNCVFNFSSDSQTNGDDGLIRKHKLSDPIKQLKLYYSDEIIITSISKNCASEDKRKVFAFPKRIRNVSVELNKCQLRSIIVKSSTDVGAQYLVASVGKKILIYNYLNESLLKLIDAHSARIVKLIPILRRQDFPENQQNNLAHSRDQLNIASASMDKTVKIWNLLNLDKDIYTLDKMDGCIEALALSKNQQQPLAACLARGQLGLWDWQRLRLIRKLSEPELRAMVKSEASNGTGGFSDNGAAKLEGKILKCCFSSNARYLSVVTNDSIYLLSMENAGKREAKSSNNDLLNLKLNFIFNFSEQSNGNGLIAMRNLFFQQDSRILTVFECNQISAQIGQRNSSPTLSSPSSSKFSSLSDANNPSIGDSRLSNVRTKRQLVYCHSVPDGRLVYTMQYLSPRIMNSNSFASSGLTNPVQAQTDKERDEQRQLQVSDGGIRQETSANISLDSNSAHSTRSPVLTRDQLHIVTVVCGDLSAQFKTDEGPENKGASGKRIAAHRRLSNMNKVPLLLNVYSSRDGQLVKTIDLNELGTWIEPPSGPAIQGNPKERKPSAEGAGRIMNPMLNVSGLVNGQERTISRSAVADAKSTSISISGEQFSKLKAVVYRDKQSVVALMDTERGSSYFVDVSTKQLIASSNNWNGKISSDGRYGLSKMFKSTASFKASSSSAAAANHNFDSMNSLEGGPGAASGSPDGLKLLEMRHFSSIKTLLTNELRSKLASSSGRNKSFVDSSGQQATNSDIICAFTRPNDAYVYYYDARLNRLLLIRMRDGQLIANYKISATKIMDIKCSADGLALILSASDGSLTSLAIVDAHRNETLVRLNQYPSRNRR